MPRTTKTVKPITDRDRPVIAFGELLQELRKERSVQEMLNSLRDRTPHVDTSQGTVSGYEQGYNKKPDPVVLWGLAKAYPASLEGLIAVLHANRQDPKLSLDSAKRVLREHSRGPSPEVAASALEAAEGRILAVAGDITAIREGLRPEQTPPPHSRRQTADDGE